MDKPIIFSTDMVKAILSGRKTQTRRVIKPQPPLARWGISQPWETSAFEVDRKLYKCPYKPGDTLIPAKDIIGYDVQYCADFFGNIWSKASGEWRKLKANETAGYLRLTLRMNGKDVNRTVHKLVCAAYYGDPPFGGAVVRHLDGNSLNNAPDNLDWGTYSQNWDDAKFHGTMIHEKHHNAKITMEIAERMRESGKTAWELSKEYNLAPKTINRILNGQTWKPAYEQAPPNMPREASRIRLLVKSVRVERVQDIMPDDVLLEGLVDVGTEVNALDRFAESWDSISAKRGFGWVTNPYVWVIEFEVI